jgi:hypothetical protein
MERSRSNITCTGGMTIIAVSVDETLVSLEDVIHLVLTPPFVPSCFLLLLLLLLLSEIDISRIRSTCTVTIIIMSSIIIIVSQDDVIQCTAIVVVCRTMTLKMLMMDLKLQSFPPLYVPFVLGTQRLQVVVQEQQLIDLQDDDDDDTRSQ